jgi:hypothetical protein
MMEELEKYFESKIEILLIKHARAHRGGITPILYFFGARAGRDTRLMHPPICNKLAVKIILY